MRFEALTPIHTKSDSGRVSIPKHFSEHVPWIAGAGASADALQAWVLLLSPGRYRLLSDAQVQSDPYLRPVRLLILEGLPVSPMGPSSAEEAEQVAIVAKLVPVSIAPPEASGPGWRVSL